MQKRRQFLKTAIGFLAGTGLLFSPFLKAVRLVYGSVQRIILPKDTDRKSLIHKDPGTLDTRNLETTPLKDFRTMGTYDHEVDVARWRLRVAGCVKTPFKLTYTQILTLPSIERKVLLICPGVFTNHGRWKGISMEKLLANAKVEKGATHVIFSGPEGDDEKQERFPLADVLSNKVFLAYGVNGETLPKKHGFPLRVVAEDYYGSDWVKYVSSVEVDKA